MEPRTQFTRNAKATLIHEWTVGVGDKAETYRLIAVGNYSAGYEDRYIIEKLGNDGLGEPRWDAIHTWKPESKRDDATTLLVEALKTARGAR